MIHNGKLTAHTHTDLRVGKRGREGEQQRERGKNLICFQFSFACVFLVLIAPCVCFFSVQLFAFVVCATLCVNFQTRHILVYFQNLFFTPRCFFTHFFFAHTLALGVFQLFSVIAWKLGIFLNSVLFFWLRFWFFPCSLSVRPRCIFKQHSFGGFPWKSAVFYSH